MKIAHLNIMYTVCLFPLQNKYISQMQYVLPTFSGILLPYLSLVQKI